MKTTKTKIAAIALGAAISVATLTGGLMLNKSAITASADENDGIMTVSSHTLKAPAFETPISYYCMVAYPVVNLDKHSECNTVYLKSAPSSGAGCALKYYETSIDDSIYNDDTRYYIVPSSTTSEKCIPLYQYATTYCSVCGAQSSATQLTKFASANFKITGYTAQYTVISTSYASACTWTYSGTVGQQCFYTLAYNGEIANSTYAMTTSEKEHKETLDGVTFRIKISNTSIKIKASKTVTTDVYNTMFAFYVYG